jgi:acyl transferase domain-containing protein/NAD(P)-dependent dehydrogenase (short-subunit alcohol dehydrogenase family)/acyl carrier protein
VTQFPQPQRRRIAGVNSFGYGGTNAHAVLAEPPPAPPLPPAGERPLWLPLSAKTPAALAELAARHLEEIPQWSQCRAAGVHRSHHRHRAAAVGDLGAALRALVEGREDPALVQGTPAEGKLVFVYTGMGPQWWGMGQELLATEPVFREAVQQCDAAFQAVSGWSILSEMHEGQESSRMARTEVAQPANAALQIGLTALWASWGVRPDAVVGHSIGEVGSAVASGALAVHEGMTVAYHRSRLQQRLAGRGGMLAAGVSLAEAEAIVAASPGLAVAAVNSDSAVTLAGDSAALEEVARELAAAGRFVRALQVEVPYHSPVMEEIEAELKASLRTLRPLAPQVPLYSTVTGALLDDQPMDAAYFYHNVREPVRFAQALQALLAGGPATFVEVGPHPVLASSLRDGLRSAGLAGQALPSLVRTSPERATLVGSLARLYTLGFDPDFRGYFGPGAHVPLPRYPWQRTRPWSEGERTQRGRAPAEHPLVSGREGPSLVADLNLGQARWLEDHVVGGSPLFPAAGTVELALEARRLATGSARACLEDLELTAAVPLRPEQATRLVLTPESSTPSFFVDAEPGGRVARGKLLSAGSPGPRVAVEVLRQRLGQQVPAEELYERLAARGLSYGPAFRAARQIWAGEREMLAELELPEGVDEAGYHLHPVLLDAALHCLVALARGGEADIVPVGIDRLQLFESPGRSLLAWGRVTEEGEDTLTGEITLLGEDGIVLASVEGLTCRVLRRTAERQRLLAQRLYARRWELIEDEPARAEVCWFVLGGPVALPGAVHVVAAELPRALREARDRRAWVLDLRFVGEPPAEDPVGTGASMASELLETVQSLESGALDRYCLVTVGAESVGPEDAPPCLALAPLLGLARTAMTERPDLQLTCLDVDHFDPDAVTALLERAGPEQELALRGDCLRSVRVVRAPLGEPAHALSQPPAEGQGYELALGGVGKFEEIGLRSCERPEPGPGEVEIEVEYASLGFKDAMKVLGLLSPRLLRGTFFGEALGMEGSGHIVRVGPGVEGLAVGQRVYGVAPGFLRSHVVLEARRVVPLPDGLDLVAGSYQLVFMTVWHALVDVARLQPGELVLIHGASGGVGLAAIEIARRCGARVLGTAGTEDKRQFLRDRGLEYVGHSRELAFADEVRRHTGGRGVDVVLNFMPGEIVAKSLSCLARFGRFLELGKMSFDQDTALQLRPFNENLLYAAIDFDRILAHKPEDVARLSREVLQGLQRGELQPLPVQVFPASQVGEALRAMARGKHIGRICVSMRDPELRVRPAPRARFGPDGSYLVTGGLSGFGLQVARWMVSQGARHLALVSRRGEQTPGCAEILASLREQAEVCVFAADMGEGTQVERVLREVRAKMPPLRGVMHAAAALEDRRLAELDRASLERVLGAKARGAWHLHRLTAPDPLERFVLFSSVSSWIGNAGQGNYVAANTFLDQLALWRRRQGLPASAVAWGVLGEAGLVARDARLGKHLGRLGIEGLSTEDALHALGEILDRELVQPGVMDVSWDQLVNQLDPRSGASRFARLADSRSQAATSSLAARWARSPEGMVRELTELVCASVARILRVPEPDPEVPLRELGLDSLLAMEILSELEGKLGVKIPAMAIASGPSVHQLVAALARQLLREAPSAEPAGEERGVELANK